MALDFQTRNVLKKFVAEQSSKKTLFLGYPTVIVDNEGDEDSNFINSFFGNGWECVDINPRIPDVKCCDFVSTELGDRYNMIVDHGSLQHFYDPFSGIKNTIRHLSEDGIGFHMLPYNGYGGFGYWQIGPEIFIELHRQGIIEITQIGFIEQGDKNNYYVINKFEEISEFAFLGRVRVFVIYKKIEDCPPGFSVFQEQFDQPEESIIVYKSVSRYRLLVTELVAALYQIFAGSPLKIRRSNRNLMKKSFIK